MTWVIILILVVIVILPKLMFRLIMKLRYVKRLKEYSHKPFICHNCGEKFYVKWYKLWVWGETSIIVTGNATLKCEHCGTKDRCKWEGSL